MATFDIIILLCFLPAIYLGLKNGLVKQIISFCVIFFGIKLSLQFSAPVGEWVIEKLGMKEFLGKVLSFIVIFLVVSLVFTLVGRAVEKIIKITLLGWLNRLLGVLLALAVAAIAISVLVQLFDTLNGNLHIVEEAKIAESKFYPHLLDLAKEVFPRIKEII